jgi:hypothetical protein
VRSGTVEVTLFGRRQRRNLALEQRLFRAEVAADARARLALTDAVGNIGSTVTQGLRHAQHAQAATEVAVEHLWRKVLDREQELARAVEQVAQVCELLAERIESEQLERRALADAMTLLARQTLPVVSTPRQERLVGGSVFATPSAPNNDEAVLIHDPAAGALMAPSPANTDVAEPAGRGGTLEDDDGTRRTLRNGGWQLTQ